MDQNPAYRIELAYDGTEFCGWEKQAQGERTVRGTLERGLERLCGRPVSVAGAGRTDSGVHALGQVATFRLDKEWDISTLLKAVNANLPDDLRALRIQRVPKDFHARFSARYKTYFYQIYCAPFADPFRTRYYHRMLELPDREAIRRGCEILVGEKNFAAMMAAGSRVDSTRRRILSIKVRGGRDWVRVFFTGEGFLYKMVRNMISLIISQARGELSRDAAQAILDSGNRDLAPPTFPAKGLFLFRVVYG